MAVVTRYNTSKNATWQCFCVVARHNSHRDCVSRAETFLPTFSSAEKVGRLRMRDSAFKEKILRCAQNDRSKSQWISKIRDGGFLDSRLRENDREEREWQKAGGSSSRVCPKLDLGFRMTGMSLTLAGFTAFAGFTGVSFTAFAIFAVRTIFFATTVTTFFRIAWEGELA